MNRRYFLRLLGVAPLVPLAARLPDTAPSPDLYKPTPETLMQVANGGLTLALTDDDVHYFYTDPLDEWTKAVSKAWMEAKDREIMRALRA